MQAFFVQYEPHSYRFELNWKWAKMLWNKEKKIVINKFSMIYGRIFKFYVTRLIYGLAYISYLIYQSYLLLS